MAQREAIGKSIPRRGIYHGIEGLADAQSVAGITGVTITAALGAGLRITLAKGSVEAQVTAKTERKP